VDENSGSVTFIPAPAFVGTAVMNVRLVGRNGTIYIHPMKVRVGASSRVLVLTGDVPSDIKGGLLRVR
jgi:hypothetical protein